VIVVRFLCLFLVSVLALSSSSGASAGEPAKTPTLSITSPRGGQTRQRVIKIAGTLQGVNQSTALLRAVAMGVTLYLCGRIIGWFLGRSLAGMKPGEPSIGIAETESTRA